MDLILARAEQDDGVACDGFEAGVTGVLVRHGDEAGLGAGDRVSGLRVRRIGEHDSLPAAHSEASVAEPGHVHRGDHNTRNQLPNAWVLLPERPSLSLAPAS